MSIFIARNRDVLFALLLLSTHVPKAAEKENMKTSKVFLKVAMMNVAMKCVSSSLKCVHALEVLKSLYKFTFRLYSNNHLEAG